MGGSGIRCVDDVALIFALPLISRAEACTKVTHEYIRSYQYQRSVAATRSDHASTVISDSEVETDYSQDSDAAEKDTFKIILRSGSTKNITVTVRPTTKCGAIVATFLKRTGIKNVKAKKVKLVIDGERMEPDTAIEEADLEDGDIVDIMGI